MPGSRRASIVFPVPGGPASSRLCPPAAASSSARPGSLLAAHVSKIRQALGRIVGLERLARLRPPLALEIGSGLGQVVQRDRVDAREEGLGSRGRGAKQMREPLPAGSFGRGEYARNRPHPPVQR